MPRPPDGPVARTAFLHVRMSPEDLAAIDAARGTGTRSAYIRDLIEDAATEEDLYV